MKDIESIHSPGLVGVPCSTLARYLGLFDSLNKLKVPTSTDLRFAEGVNVAYNCNNLVQEMLDNPALGWLWIMGDDHRFLDTTLIGLLDRQVDIVVPVVSRRGMPFQTVLYKVASEESYLTYSWGDLSRENPNGGLVAVEGAGTAGMLIRRHVLEAMPKPWFEWGQRISEDIGFCIKARKLGYEIVADLDQRLTHTTTCELEPYRNKDGNWDVAVNVAGRAVSLLNTPFRGEDLREATYGRKPGNDGLEWLGRGQVSS